MVPQFSIRFSSSSREAKPSWVPLFDRVRAADRAGVDRIVMSGEHVVFGEHPEAYERPELGGRARQTPTMGPDGHFLEPMVTMSMICAVTSRVRVTSSIMLAALRRPIVLAKSAATLDVLSGGRLDLAVGVGWQREEYGAAGLDFDARGRLLDHSLEVCRTLWSQSRASYSSPELSFENMHAMPKPLDPNGVPIWVSGQVKARSAMRRLARFGCGWVPWGPASDEGDVEALVRDIPLMRDAVSGHGRDGAEIQVCGKLPVVRDAAGTALIGPSMEAMQPLLEAGVTEIRAQLPVPDESSAAEDYLAEWVGGFRDAVR
jgi:probable F420-dependent oxidoreductase